MAEIMQFFKFEFLTTKIKEILNVGIPVVERAKADNQNIIAVIISLKISYNSLCIINTYNINIHCIYYINCNILTNATIKVIFA